MTDSATPAPKKPAAKKPAAAKPAAAKPAAAKSAAAKPAAAPAAKKPAAAKSAATAPAAAPYTGSTTPVAAPAPAVAPAPAAAAAPAAPATAASVPVATAPVAPATTRSAVPWFVLGGAAVVALAANIWGGLNFPYNAPIEQIMCFGFVVDLIAILILSLIGVIIARQPLTVKPSSMLGVVGMGMTALVLLLVILGAWIPQLTDLSNGIPLHYSSETGPAFFLAPVWITGLAFSGFAYRRGGSARNNLFCILGLAFGIAIFALAAFSAVIYGLGLTT